MATITDLVHDVIGYLYTQAQISPALGANPLNPVLIMDGPTIPGEQTTEFSQLLWIGYDAVSATTDMAAARQKFAFLGANGNVRDENGEIICTAAAWSGDTIAATARALCKGIVGGVEIMLRGAPATGPGDSTMGGLVQWSEVAGPFEWKHQQSYYGYGCACVFRVQYFARLNP